MTAKKAIETKTARGAAHTTTAEQHNEGGTMNDRRNRDPVMAVETVTPDAAREMLTRNTRNRPVSRSHVLRLAALIKSGLWRVTGQGIAFAVDGTLVDGQHRLLAIIEAGVAVRIGVTRDVAIDAMDAIDTGEPRRARHILAISDGRKLTTNETAALIVANALAKRATLSKWQSSVTVYELRAALREHGEDMQAVLSTLGVNHDRLSSAAMVGSLICAHRTRPERTTEFCRLLRSGAGMDEGHPVLALRNFVTLKHTSAGGSSAREDLSLKTFAAMEAFEAGRKVSLLRGGVGQRAKYLAPWRAEEG